jgi:hypothetical protein
MTRDERRGYRRALGMARAAIAVLTLVLAVGVAMSGKVATAEAATLPDHWAPAPTWCNNDSSPGSIFKIKPGFASINSGYPYAGKMPDAGTTVLHFDGTPDVRYGDEEIDFRIVAAWWDPSVGWRYANGNWMRKFNDNLVWQSQALDGSWYTAVAGDLVFDNGGGWDLGESHIFVPAGRTYWVGYQYYWAPFSGSTFAGASDFQWYTKVSC